MDSYSKCKLNNLLYKLEAFAEPKYKPSSAEKIALLLKLRAENVPWDQIARKTGYTKQGAITILSRLKAKAIGVVSTKHPFSKYGLKKRQQNFASWRFVRE